MRAGDASEPGSHLVLYYYPVSPFVRKVRMALEEKRLSYRRVFVNLATSEQYTGEFLALSPHRKVPVLVHGHTVIYESTAIIDYLDVLKPDPPLWPAAWPERVRARQLEECADVYFYGAIGPLVLDAIAAGLSHEEQALVERAKRAMREQLFWLDRELAGRSFLAGACSAADLAFAAGLGMLEGIGYAVPARLRNLAAWGERMRERPSWKMALGVRLKVRDRRPLRRPLRCACCGLPPSEPPDGEGAGGRRGGRALR